jgi:hypothetical protein
LVNFLFSWQESWPRMAPMYSWDRMFTDEFIIYQALGATLGTFALLHFSSSSLSIWSVCIRVNPWFALDSDF